MVRRIKKQDAYSGLPTTEIPIYTIKEAAHYLHMPDSTLRYWVLGKTYPTEKGEAFAVPLVVLEGIAKKKRLLTFSNLVEAHVLSAIRRSHRIPLPKIREALDFVERKKGIKRPLINEDFETDGADLFVQQLGSLINATGQGQCEIREFLAAHLSRIERDEKKLLFRLFPFTRDHRNIDQPRHVVIDPRIAFGRPIIAGTGVPTSMVARRFKAGESTADLSRDYRCSREQIEEALRCEQAEAA